MGLDAVVATNDAAKFRARLSKLIGERERVMPRSEFFGQPAYDVGETAEEIYTLRGIVAHGNEIPVRFRDRVGIRVTDATSALPDGWDTWTYSYVLSQCALFLLSAAVQRIYEDERVFNLAAGESSVWKNWLDR
mgnify:CR=1 FL=1